MSFRPRSEQEIKERLLKKSFSEDTIRDVLFFLKEQNYINDREFAQIWAESQISRKPMSRSLLKYQLRQKGIDEEIISDLLGQIKEGLYDEEQPDPFI